MIHILVADPDCLILEQPGGLWIASGFAPIDKEALRGHPTRPQALELCRRICDSTIIYVSLQGNTATRVEAWRGITTGFEVFYSIRRDGTVLVSDSFRNILTRIEPGERGPSESAILDHFLFRTVPGEGTYSTIVKRVGHGDHLTIDLEPRAAKIASFDKIARKHERGSIDDYVARVDAALQRAVSRIDDVKLTCLFSGGIDSALIQAYRKQRDNLVVYLPERLRPGTPDPLVYSSRAASLLDKELTVQTLREYDLWSLIENNIATAGWPQRVVQNAMYGDAFASSAKGYILGIRGDALFGADGTRAAVLAAKIGASWNPLNVGVQLMAKVPVGHLSRRAEGLLRSASGLQQAPTSVHGNAAETTSRGFSDYSIIARAVGWEALHERLANRLRYVSSRLTVDPRATTALARHLEMAHWIDYWCEDNPSFIRQLAFAHGKSAYMPFLAYLLVDAAMSIPAEERYHEHLEVKYILKRLISHKLPGYPAYQRKGITAVDLPSTFEGRIRAAIWDKYPISDFIPKDQREKVEQFQSPISFSALALAIMEKQVLRNPNLSEMRGTRRFSFCDPFERHSMTERREKSGEL